MIPRCSDAFSIFISSKFPLGIMTDNKEIKDKDKLLYQST
jgi:hypothetical protein